MIHSHKKLVQEIGEDTQIQSKDVQDLELTSISIKTSKPNLSARLSPCVVCRKKCQYRCPSCHKNYCSIPHFRSHNLFCSEKFYQKQVTQTLKGIKVTDKQQKRKAAEMVRQNAEKMEDLFMSGAHLTEQRLEELLKDLEQGCDPKLTPKEEILFQKYLREATNDEQVQEGSAQQDELKCLKLPFWEVEDGLGIYRQKQVDMEEYGESEHPQIIAYRDLARKRLDEYQRVHVFQSQATSPIKKLPKKELYLHLFQLVHTFVLLYRAYNGEENEFIPIFINSYTSKENEQLLKAQNISLESLLKCMQIQLVTNIDRQERRPLELWMSDYWPILIKDMQKICANKFLILETLLRIIDHISLLKQNQKQQEGQHAQVLTKADKIGLKVSKKCEYLLLILLIHFQMGKWKEILASYCSEATKIYETAEKQRQMFEDIKKMQQKGLLIPGK